MTKTPNPRIPVCVVGATGYTGSELCALLAAHPAVEIAGLFGSARSEAVPFERVHPALAGRKGPDVTVYSREALARLSPACVFLATPNEFSAEEVPSMIEAGISVIDLSGAFRLRRAEAYDAWYGFRHPSPALLGEAVYGLPEWCNGDLKGRRLVANPGCYPTSVLLAAKPLFPLLDASRPIVCDSKSGVSGAGKRSDLPYSFAEMTGNFKAYGIGRHRHEPEMRQELGLPDDRPFVFVPHLLPIVRGILSTLYVEFSRPVPAQEIAEAYAGAYAGSAFVGVRPEGETPDLRAVVGTPRAEIGFKILEGGRSAVVVSVLDNLLKGAASQAVQNFNHVFDLDERTGLL